MITIFCLKAMAFVFGFFIISLLFANFLTGITQLITAKKFNFIVKWFSFFGLFFCKNGEKWSNNNGGFMPFCECVMNFNKESLKQDSIELQKRFYLFENYSTLTISLLFNIYTIYLFFSLVNGKSLSMFDIFYIGFSFGMLFHSFRHLKTTNYIYNILYKGFLGYVQSKCDLMKFNENFDNFDLKPIEELPYKSISNAEKIIYYLLYCNYLLSLNRIEEMKKVSQELSELVIKQMFLLNFCKAYYWLIFYYSEFEIDKEKADIFLKKAKPALSIDNDPSAKMVLAYYSYRMYEDKANAMSLIEEGLSVVDDNLILAEKNLQKKLLLNLKNEIESKK